MSSGPSVILVITKGDTGDTIIEEWRELLGPKKVEDAKDTAPERLDHEIITNHFIYIYISPVCLHTYLVYPYSLFVELLKKNNVQIYHVMLFRFEKFSNATLFFSGDRGYLRKNGVALIIFNIF